jgi:ribosomal protein S18 acetylase RimI-like enzyme
MHTIERLNQLDDATIAQLAELLTDVVASGGSISFMHPVTPETGRAYWQSIAAQIASGERVIVVARNAAGQIIGSAQAILAQPENQPHRADIAKVMVHSTARKRGVGDALMRAVEAHARDAGKTVLVLDTETGEAGSRLYTRLGWQVAGHIPDYALKPHGGLCSTTYFYKRIGASQAA